MCSRGVLKQPLINGHSSRTLGIKSFGPSSSNDFFLGCCLPYLQVSCKICEANSLALEDKDVA